MLQHVNGIDLWYEKMGNGAPILLLHGNGESHKIFDILTKQLAAAYTVYALDSRDHGQSSKTRELSYALMTDDTAQFIKALNLEKPIVFGFSDGGIIGLLLASKYPDLLSKLVVSGANTSPAGMRPGWRCLFQLIYFITRDRKYHMMLTEPHLTAQDLGNIKIPVLVLAGEKDMIKEADTQFIAAHIPGASLKILANEGHASYVTNSPKLYPLLEAFL